MADVPSLSSSTNTPNETTDTGGSDVGGSTAQAIPPKEKTKSFLSKFFVISTMTSIGLIPPCLLILHTINLDGYKDILLTLGSILGGPLGIIINNYFKEGSDK